MTVAGRSSDFTGGLAPDALFEAMAELVRAGTAFDEALLQNTRFDDLRQRFGLSAPEGLLLTLLAGKAVDPQLSEALTDRLGTSNLGVSVLMGLLAGLKWSSFLPTGTLRSWALIRMSESGTRASSPVELDTRILDWCFGEPGPDGRLLPYIRLPLSPVALTADAQGLAAQAAERIAARAERGAAGPMLITGADPTTRDAVATELAGILRLAPLRLDVDLLHTSPADRFALLRLVARETVLDRTIPIYAMDELDRETAESLARLEGPALVLTRRVAAPDALPPDHDCVTLSDPDAEARATLWHAALGPCNEAEVFDLAESFAVGADDIARISAGLDTLPADKRPIAARQAARRILTPPPDPLVNEITPRATWSDLVLPEATLGQLKAVAAQIRHRAVVYRQWRFAGRSNRGLGVSALFSGPSGTGKTLAAEVLASALDLPLLAVNLAQVVDKYIGETEKHLDRVFGLAERTGSIVFFDEAESLFRQRGDGDSASERFSSMTVAYLLQRLEASPATCLLATNMRGAVDDAFLRRLRFAVHFAFPAAPERLRLWQGAFPKEAPCEPLPFAALATLPATGGTIRNAALNAAFRAADRGDAIGLEDILAALELENTKLAQPIDLAPLRRRIR